MSKFTNMVTDQILNMYPKQIREKLENEKERFSNTDTFSLFSSFLFLIFILIIPIVVWVIGYQTYMNSGPVGNNSIIGIFMSCPLNPFWLVFFFYNFGVNRGIKYVECDNNPLIEQFCQM